MRKITRFFREAYAELRKVVWPTRRRTARLTMIVAIITVAAGAFLASIDYGLGKGIEYVIDTTQDTNNQAGGDAQSQPIQVPAGSTTGGGQAAPVELPGVTGGDPVPAQPQSGQ